MTQIRGENFTCAGKPDATSQEKERDRRNEFRISDRAEAAHHSLNVIARRRGAADKIQVAKRR